MLGFYHQRIFYRTDSFSICLFLNVTPTELCVITSMFHSRFLLALERDTYYEYTNIVKKLVKNGQPASRLVPDIHNRWQLDSKTEKVLSLSPGRGTLTNKRVPKPKHTGQLGRNFTCFFGRDLGSTNQQTLLVLKFT